MTKKKQSSANDVEAGEEGGEEMLTVGETPAPKKPPPPKDSLMDQMELARNESSNPAQFLVKLVSIFSRTEFCLFFGFLMTGLPIAMIVIGAMHRNDCPLEHYIPIYLIVSGVFGSFIILSSVMSPLCKRCSRNDKKYKEHACCKFLNILNGLVWLFLFCWFICGNVWVYNNYNQVDTRNTTSPRYCNELVYNFAFWTINVTYILLELSLVCSCSACITCCAWAYWQGYRISVPSPPAAIVQA